MGSRADSLRHGSYSILSEKVPPWRSSASSPGNVKHYIVYLFHYGERRSAGELFDQWDLGIHIGCCQVWLFQCIKEYLIANVLQFWHYKIFFSLLAQWELSTDSCETTPGMSVLKKSNIKIAHRLNRPWDPGVPKFACWVVNRKLVARNTTFYPLNNMMIDSILWHDGKSILVVELYVQWDPVIMSIPFLDAISNIGKLSGNTLEQKLSASKYTNFFCVIYVTSHFEYQHRDPCFCLLARATLQTLHQVQSTSFLLGIGYIICYTQAQKQKKAEEFQWRLKLEVHYIEFVAREAINVTVNFKLLASYNEKIFISVPGVGHPTLYLTTKLLDIHMEPNCHEDWTVPARVFLPSCKAYILHRIQARAKYGMKSYFGQQYKLHGGKYRSSRCPLYLGNISTCVLDQKISWDPGGVHRSGLRASWNLRGRECHVQLLEAWAWLWWASDASWAWWVQATNHISMTSDTEGDRTENELNLRLLPLSSPTPLDSLLLQV